MNPVVAAILAAHRGRDPALLALKWAKLRSLPFAFFRGTAPLFYTDWARAKAPPCPLVWMCGDAHLENTGSYRGDDGVAYFDLNDFDEALLAPAHFELGRALAGLYLVRRARLAPLFLEAYLARLATGKPRRIEPEVAEGNIAQLLATVAARRPQDFLAERVKAGKLRLRPGHSYALAPGVRRRALRTFARWAATQPKPAFYAPLDICGRIAGNGSLGLERHMILVRGRKRPHIIDMKQAAPSAAGPWVRAAQPAWSCEAERVSTTQYFLQFAPPAHRGWIDAGTASYMLRELQPSEDRIDRTRLSPGGHEELVQQWARLIASAHLRCAGWRGSADLDTLMKFGTGLGAAAQKQLLNAARRAAQYQQAAFEAFRAHGPGA